MNWSGDYIRELAEALRELETYLHNKGWSGFYLQTDYTEELKFDVVLLITKKDQYPQKALREWESFYGDIDMFEHKNSDGNYFEIMKHLNIKIKIM